MIEDNTRIGIIAGFYAIALFTSGMGLGSGLSANGNITKGRNQGMRHRYRFVGATEKPGSPTPIYIIAVILTTVSSISNH